ncbi:MAG: hypothetical protein ACYCPQ_03825 [Elusimicrobiota bacterium]
MIPAQTSKEAANADDTRLKELWRRLEAVARRLWIENSATAVGLQSLIEEFQSEISRIEDLLRSYRVSYQEQRELLEKTYFQDKISELESSLRAAQEKIEALGAELTRKKEKIHGMEKLLGEKDESIARAHESHIKSTLENSEEFNRKIETLYQDVLIKESELVPLWEKRRQELEEQYRSRIRELEEEQKFFIAEAKKQGEIADNTYREKLHEIREAQQKTMGEITDWSSRKLKEEQDILRRSQTLDLKVQEMEHEIKKREKELELIKEKLQQEVATVVRQYQSAAPKT